MMANLNLQLPDGPQHQTVYEHNLRLHNRLWDNLSSLATKNRSKDTSLHILHHNVKSLYKKFHYYESLNLTNCIDIFSVSETWLKPELPDQMISLLGFNLVRCDRKSATKTRGGGAALYINSNYSFTELSQPRKKLKQLCDSVWVNIKMHQNSDPLIIASIYLSPDSDKQNFVALLSDILHQKNFIGKKVILLGDFNINWNSNSRDKQHIHQCLTSAGLQQVVVGTSFISNHGNESLLDHNYVNCDLLVDACKILTCDRSISDHYATFLQIGRIKPVKAKRLLIKTRNFRKLNPLHFYNDCSHLPLLQIASDHNLSIHERTEKLDQLIISVVDKHAPEKTVRVRCKKNQWLTPEIQRLITLRNKYYNQVFKSAHSLPEAQIEQYKKFRNYVTNQIRAAKKNYISRSLSESDKSFYSCLKSMTKKGKSETTIEQIVYNNTTYKDGIDIASALNEFFVKVGGQSEFDPTKHKSQPVANQQTFAFS